MALRRQQFFGLSELMRDGAPLTDLNLGPFERIPRSRASDFAKSGPANPARAPRRAMNTPKGSWPGRR